MPQPKLFVGSSQEAADKEYGERLARRLQNDVEIVPWTESFEPMVHHLENIEQLARSCDGALFLFCADDLTLRRDQLELVTRPNVVFECGYFMGVCGRDRVLIVVEARDDANAAVAMPSDMQGLTYVRIELNKQGTVTEAAFDRLAEQVRTFLQRWHGTTDDTAVRAVEELYGFRKTFAQGRKWIRQQQVALAQPTVGHSGAVEPIRIESQSLCMTTYAEALARVQSSFRTTSLLSSGFWSRPSVQVLDANNRMMNRLKSREGTEAHRLFLLEVSLGEIRSRWIDLAASRREYEGEDGLRALRTELRYLRGNIEELNAMGFDTRIVYAGDERYTFNLPSELGFKPDRCELAIYDDWRFDVFVSERPGLITEVRCYTPAMGAFPTFLDRVSKYYEMLWADARPIESLLDVLEEAVDHVVERIDYERNWLIRYEAELAGADRRLKRREFEGVRRQLRANGRWGTIRRYLDIGTCTGRYVLALREAVQPDGEVLGIDNDLDCTAFAEKKVRELESTAGSPSISILFADFQRDALPFEGPFDLITCMLGTLSHFGCKRRHDPPFDDPLQRAIGRMAGLLDQHGYLFLGAWASYAVEHRKMLAIYRAEDLRRLADWTPSQEELGVRLEQAGLEYQVIPVEERLNLYHCTRTRRPSTQETA